MSQTNASTISLSLTRGRTVRLRCPYCGDSQLHRSRIKWWDLPILAVMWRRARRCWTCGWRGWRHIVHA